MVVANALVEKQRVQLVSMHKDGCPCKTRQCEGKRADSAVYTHTLTKDDSVSLSRTASDSCCDGSRAESQCTQARFCYERRPDKTSFGILPLDIHSRYD